MTADSDRMEIERLRSECAALGQLLEVHEQTALVQTSRLEESLLRLQDQAVELEDRGSRLRALFEAAVDGIITVDEDGIIETVNGAASEIFGYAVEEMVGQDVKMLVPPAYREAHDAGMARHKKTRIGRVIGERLELAGLRKDGSTFDLGLSIGRVELKGRHVFIGLLRDISDRKKAEERLDRARAELLEAKEQAEAANAAKSRFMANMSHELRTPLNAIIGYSEMLEEDATADGRTQAVADLQRIQSAGKHLLDLINDVLDLSKVEAGRMGLDVAEFSVREIVEGVLTIAEPLAARANNRVEVAVGETVGSMTSDGMKLRQCLLNLLSNAAKFTEQGLISLAVERRDGDVPVLVFRVSDTGIGMSEAAMQNVFEAFCQADTRISTKYGGTGLGLAITRHCCRLMGGDITVESVVGEGSTLTMTLPEVVQIAERRPRVGVEEVPEAAAPPRHGSKILVVDDDANARDLMSRFLGRRGFAVITAQDGAEGIRLAREHRPRLITLDVVMPVMDGWATLTALKADPELAAIPVIMMTMLEEPDLGYTLGAVEYLTKPVEMKRLLGLLDTFCCDSPPCPVLVVEDDPPTRELLLRALAKRGWSTSAAADGREALERMTERTPELILLDLMMPVMDGFEFLDEIRKREDWRDIPVIVVTARELSAGDRRRLNGSVDRILQKGVCSKDELLEEILRVISSRIRVPR